MKILLFCGIAVIVANGADAFEWGAYCSAPPVPLNGDYSPKKPNYPLGSSIGYFCYEGYKIRGTKTRQCLWNGRFSDGFEGCTAEIVNPCDRNPCDSNALCTNIDGDRYKCKCVEGYDGNGKVCSRSYCVTPEFIENGQFCPAQRTYKIGSFVTYTCNDGYRLKGSANRECLATGNFNGSVECVEILPCDRNPCHDKAHCTDINEKLYRCDCVFGYTGNGKFCRKLRPCEHEPCHVNATCEDIDDKTFRCDCIPGFKGNGKDCIRIFPCETNPCHEMANCTNLSYTRYSCKCIDGFEGDGQYCQRIDPCKNHFCHKFATCKANYDGVGYTCQCNDGYFGNGFSCKKPCDDHECHPKAICHGHPNGNHSCICMTGYVGSGKMCKRYVSPCRLMNCPKRSRCYVYAGRAVCQCVAGHFFDFRGECIKHCNRPDFPEHGRFSPIQETYPEGSEITYTCDEGFKLKGSETRQCLSDGKFSGSAICIAEPTTTVLYSCENNCGVYSFGIGCRCDPDCRTNRNCCPDYDRYCNEYYG